MKIKLNEKDLALVSADAQDIGNASELVPVSFDFDQFDIAFNVRYLFCLLYTSPSPRDLSTSRMPSSA